MARPLRIEYPGAFYHITSRGNERKAVFRSDFDRERFLSYLQMLSPAKDAPAPHRNADPLSGYLWTEGLPE